MRVHKHIAPWAGLLLACAVAAAAHAAPKVGTAPPDYLGKTPVGKQVLISDRRGRVLVVGFWASWCNYCRAQFPLLDRLQRTIGRERLEVILVNFKEPTDDYRTARLSLKHSPVTWTHDVDGAISDAFGVELVPRLFLINKRGEVAHVEQGVSETQAAEVIEAVNALLAEPGPDGLATGGG